MVGSFFHPMFQKQDRKKSSSIGRNQISDRRLKKSQTGRRHTLGAASCSNGPRRIPSSLPMLSSPHREAPTRIKAAEGGALALIDCALESCTPPTRSPNVESSSWPTDTVVSGEDNGTQSRAVSEAFLDLMFLKYHYGT